MTSLLSDVVVEEMTEEPPSPVNFNATKAQNANSTDCQKKHKLGLVSGTPATQPETPFTCANFDTPKQQQPQDDQVDHILTLVTQTPNQDDTFSPIGMNMTVDHPEDHCNDADDAVVDHSSRQEKPDIQPGQEVEKEQNQNQNPNNVQEDSFKVERELNLDSGLTTSSLDNQVRAQFVTPEVKMSSKRRMFEAIHAIARTPSPEKFEVFANKKELFDALRDVVAVTPSPCAKKDGDVNDSKAEIGADDVEEGESTKDQDDDVSISLSEFHDLVNDISAENELEEEMNKISASARPGELKNLGLNVDDDTKCDTSSIEVNVNEPTSRKATETEQALKGPFLTPTHHQEQEFSYGSSPVSQIRPTTHDRQDYVEDSFDHIIKQNTDSREKGRDTSGRNKELAILRDVAKLNLAPELIKEIRDSLEKKSRQEGSPPRYDNHDICHIYATPNDDDISEISSLDNGSIISAVSKRSINKFRPLEDISEDFKRIQDLCTIKSHSSCGAKESEGDDSCSDEGTGSAEGKDIPDEAEDLDNYSTQDTMVRSGASPRTKSKDSGTSTSVDVSGIDTFLHNQEHFIKSATIFSVQADASNDSVLNVPSPSCPSESVKDQSTSIDGVISNFNQIQMMRMTNKAATLPVHDSDVEEDGPPLPPTPMSGTGISPRTASDKHGSPEATESVMTAFLQTKQKLFCNSPSSPSKCEQKMESAAVDDMYTRASATKKGHDQTESMDSVIDNFNNIQMMRMSNEILSLPGEENTSTASPIAMSGTGISPRKPESFELSESNDGDNQHHRQIGSPVSLGGSRKGLRKKKLSPTKSAKALTCKTSPSFFRRKFHRLSPSMEDLANSGSDRQNENSPTKPGFTPSLLSTRASVTVSRPKFRLEPPRLDSRKGKGKGRLSDGYRSDTASVTGRVLSDFERLKEQVEKADLDERASLTEDEADYQLEDAVHHKLMEDFQEIKHMERQRRWNSTDSVQTDDEDYCSKRTMKTSLIDTKTRERAYSLDQTSSKVWVANFDAINGNAYDQEAFSSLLNRNGHSSKGIIQIKREMYETPHATENEDNGLIDKKTKKRRKILKKIGKLLRGKLSRKSKKKDPMSLGISSLTVASDTGRKKSKRLKFIFSLRRKFRKYKRRSRSIASEQLDRDADSLNESFVIDTMKVIEGMELEELEALDVSFSDSEASENTSFSNQYGYSSLA